MPDVIKTYHLSASVANEDSIVTVVSRHAHPKRLHRVQVRLCSSADTALSQAVLVQKIRVLLAQKNIRSAVSVRSFDPEAAQSNPGMHEVSLFEHLAAWKTWLAKLGWGKRPTGQGTPATEPKVNTTPTNAPNASTRPASVAQPNFNLKLHEAFREAIAPYTVNDLGDWLVHSIAFNYRDPQAHTTLAPMIGAMPAPELLAYLALHAGRSNLVAASGLSVVQHRHDPVGQSTLLVGQGDLWVEVVATPACLVNTDAGEGTILPTEVVPPLASPPPSPSVRYTLASQTTTLDDLVRHINQRIKTNARLTRVELRLSHWGRRSLNEQAARAALIHLLRERGFMAVQASVKPFAHALQHADARHTLTLFEPPRPAFGWQRIKDHLAGSPGTTIPQHHHRREPMRQEPTLRNKEA